MIANKLAVVTEYLKKIHNPHGFSKASRLAVPLYFKWIGEDRIVTIYVGNLSFQASEDDLREVFAEYGEVSRVSLPTDRETGRKRGFAFVEMSSEAQEDAAITELDGAEWLGREIRVNKAKPREEGGGGGGGNRRNGGFSRD
jgi:RNA recognition motif-containing protein